VAQSQQSKSVDFIECFWLVLAIGTFLMGKHYPWWTWLLPALIEFTSAFFGRVVLAIMTPKKVVSDVSEIPQVLMHDRHAHPSH
jgi:hypothetical protein